MSRKNAPLPDSNEAWPKFVKLRIEIFSKALDALNITEEIINKENEISKMLNPELITVCRKMKLEIGIPVWDPKNRPLNDNDIKSPSANTRPDFTCSHYDTNAERNELYEINLHIECKRIGKNKSLSLKYISNGINRFDSLSHEYGKYANDGIMIGYIISSTKNEIQEIINNNLLSNIEKLNFRTKNKVENISTKFERENVEPHNFRLHHIWADYAS
jgi:hypothetical protein